MKKTILTTLATMGLALGGFAQGSLILDNNQAAHGITLNGSFYTGQAGLQVWYLNGTAYNLGSLNGAASPSAAYARLTSDGFTLATSFTGAAIGTGGFSLGDLHIAGVAPAGSAVTLAIAAWQGSGAVFGGASGVLGFYMPTVDFTAAPPPVPSDLTAGFSGQNPGPPVTNIPGGFNTTDLVLVVPEPSSFALAGLGAAALFIFRRRK